MWCGCQRRARCLSAEGAGVGAWDHLAEVQRLPGRRVDVTFTTEMARKQFLPVLQAHEVDDNKVRFVLNRYGKVLAGRRLEYREYPGVFNGVRQYRVELNKDVPSSLSFGGRDCWVRYDGQPRTCLRCGFGGHLAKECKVVRCFKCQKEGHVAAGCKEQPTCTICGESGHSFKVCPISFAQKLRQSSGWVSGGGVATPPELEVPRDVPAERAAPPEPEPVDAPAEQVAPPELEPEPEPADVPAEQAAPPEPEPEPADVPAERAVSRDVHVPEEPGTSYIVDEIFDWSLSKLDQDSQVSLPSQMSDVHTDDSSWETVRRGVKRRSSVSPRRRSRSSHGRGGNEAKELVAETQIMKEKQRWISCKAEKCTHDFMKYESFLCHMRDRHNELTISRYACPLKSCKVTCNTPKEWLNHLAGRHPQYVSIHNIDFFDRYFLLE
eukprot:XP_011682806.1 PREDICTED: uncharacterized protein LOC105446982 [Strongylocentrotus purpuratus]